MKDAVVHCSVGICREKSLRIKNPKEKLFPLLAVIVINNSISTDIKGIPIHASQHDELFQKNLEKK
jgi:hypothetical protein